MADEAEPPPVAHLNAVVSRRNLTETLMRKCSTEIEETFFLHLAHEAFFFFKRSIFRTGRLRARARIFDLLSLDIFARKLET